MSNNSKTNIEYIYTEEVEEDLTNEEKSTLKKIKEIYIKYLNLVDGDEDILEFSLGHIVWSDYNYNSVEYCINCFNDEVQVTEEIKKGISPKNLEILKQSLLELNKIPYEDRELVTGFPFEEAYELT